MRFLLIISILLIHLSYSYENIDFLNKIRQNLGLNPLFLDNELSLLSEKHLNYMKSEKIVSHEENNYNNPYYLGYKVKDRIIQFNPQTKFHHIGENISVGYIDLKDSILNLFEAPYHRFNFLRDFDYIGIAHTDSFKDKENLVVYSFGKKSMYKNNKIVIYPYTNQQNVPTFFFSDSEEPDPVKNKNVVGYPITITNFKYQNPTFMLVNERTKKMEQIIVKYKFNDKYIKDFEYLIVPLNILDYNTKYSLKILCEDYSKNKKIFQSSFYTDFYKKVNYIQDKNNFIHIKDGKPPYFVTLQNNQRVKLESNQFRLKNLKEKFTIEDSLKNN